MSLRTIRRGFSVLLIAGAGFVAWTGHDVLTSAGGHGLPATHLVADGGLPGIPPQPS